jgi:hypothetical protein
MNYKFRIRPEFLFLFFATGELLSYAHSSLATIWSFFSPLQWIASLALIMTGSPGVIGELMGIATYSGHGILSAFVAALEAGVFGTMLWVMYAMIMDFTGQASRTSALFFKATFTPIWAMLLLYKPLAENWAFLSGFSQNLEALPREVRLSTGFGILLIAVIIPILAYLGPKMMELVFQPERAYRSGK